MHSGFNRQGMSFFPNQMGSMNRFQPPQGNMNRSGAAFQNSSGFGRQQQNVGAQSSNFVRAPAPVSTNGGNSGVQSRLGPRTPITAPGKNETPASSGRPVLRRPGSQDKDKNVKPAEDKTPTVEEKKSTSGIKNDDERAPATAAAAGSNKNELKPVTSAPTKTTGKDSLMGDLPLMSTPSKYGSPSVMRPFSVAKQNSPNKPPAEKVDSEQNSNLSGTASSNSPNRFGSNMSTKPAAGDGDHAKPGPVNDRSAGAPTGRYNQTRSNPPVSSESQQSRPFEQKSGNQSDQFPNRHTPSNQAGSQSGNKNANTGATGGSDRYPGRYDAGNNEQEGKFGPQQRPSRFNANPNASNANDSNQQSRDRSFDRNANDDAGGHRVRQGPGSHGSSHWSSAPPASSAAASANKDPPRRGGDVNRSRGGFSQEKFWERLQELSGPQYDLEPLDMSEKKFNAQSRLFVGSLPRESTLEELKEMFGKYGELGQVYFNKDGAYAFINFDYHVNAEKAMRELNGTLIRGRSIKVRFAAITTGVRVKNLTANVTNELLCKAFSVFGAVEQSRVIVDDRGKPTGDGTIIFTEKKSAVMAYKKCQEESFFLTSQLRPVIVEPWENRDEEEGYPEAGLIKNEQYKKDRKVGPRFAEPNSIESEYGKQWKQLFDLYKEKRLSLESDLKAEMDALEVKMQLVVHQQETEKLRKELAQREQEALQLQMGLGSFREGGRPTQLSGDEFGGSYGKRPQDYYDMPGPGDHRTPYEQPRPYDEYYHQRGGYDRPDDRSGYNGRGQAGYENRPAGYEGRSQSYDSRTASGYDSRTQSYDSRPPASYDARGGRSAGYDGSNHGYDHASTSPYGQPPSKQGPPPSQLPPPIAASGTGAGYDAPVAPASAVAPVAAAGAAPPPSESVSGPAGDSYPSSASGYGRSSASAGTGSYGRAPAVGSSSSSSYGRSSSGAAPAAGGYDRTPTGSGQGYDVGQQGTSPYESSNKRSRY